MTWDVETMIEELATFANDDPVLLRRGRRVRCDILVGIGESDFIICLENGAVSDVRRRRLPLESGVFAIRADEAVWMEHWRAVPKRDYHDLFSMFSAGLAHIDGDLTPLMQNLLYFKMLLAAPRKMALAT